MQVWLRRAGVLLPYLAVVLGLFVAHNAWLAMMAYHAGMMILLAVASAWPQARRLGALAPGWWSMLMFLSGIGSGIGLGLLWPWLGIDSRLGARLTVWGLTAGTWLPFITYFSLVNPWLEELYWRGWLGSMSRRPVPSDLWFGGYHVLILAPFVGWPWLSLVWLSLSGASWLWRQIVRRDGSLITTFLFHLGADASIAIAIYHHVS